MRVGSKEGVALREGVRSGKSSKGFFVFCREERRKERMGEPGNYQSLADEVLPLREDVIVQ